MATRRPRALWKAHDGHILTLTVTPIGLISHGRDSAVQIWDLSEKSLSGCTADTSAIGRDVPKPSAVEIPVNSLNFCNVDYRDGLLATPATVDSNNFDVYRITSPFQQFQLSRVLENVSVSQTKKAPSDIEEINDPIEAAKRDGHGIIMRLLFLSTSILFVGYESGAVYGFHLESSTHDTSTGTERSIIAKDLKVSIIFASLEHTPSPVLSIAYDASSTKLYTGSASKQLLEYDIGALIQKYGDSTASDAPSRKTHNLRHYGIQCIKIFGDYIITGFWDGVVKGYDKSFSETFRLERQEEVIRPEESDISKPSKKSLCICTWAPTSNGTDSRKQLLRKKAIGDSPFLIVGYGDGLITAFNY